MGRALDLTVFDHAGIIDRLDVGQDIVHLRGGVAQAYQGVRDHRVGYGHESAAG